MAHLKKLQEICMSHKINYKGLSKLCEVFFLVCTKNTTCEIVPNFWSFVWIAKVLDEVSTKSLLEWKGFAISPKLLQIGQIAFCNGWQLFKNVKHYIKPVKFYLHSMVWSDKLRFFFTTFYDIILWWGLHTCNMDWNVFVQHDFF